MTLDHEKAGRTVDCKDVDERELIERYLSGQLPESESEAFEQHYLECERCFSELQFRHAAAVALAKEEPALGRGAAHRVAGRRQLNWQWGMAAAALLLLVTSSIFYFAGLDRSPSREAVLQRLASVEEPPPYVPSIIRGGEQNQALQRFQEGMNAYVQGDYRAAAGSLQDAVALNPGHLPSRFYLGISHLMLEQPGDAINHLGAVIDAGPNPYVEEAHWFVSKAYFKKNDVAQARAHLQAVIAMSGAYQEDAKGALESLEQADP